VFHGNGDGDGDMTPSTETVKLARPDPASGAAATICTFPRTSPATGLEM